MNFKVSIKLLLFKQYEILFKTFCSHFLFCIIYYYYYLLFQTKSPCEKVIRRDIARTYPEHEFFKEKDGMGQESLFNVMKAYSLHDREVGYCQGSGFIVGLLLMQVRNTAGTLFNNNNRHNNHLTQNIIFTSPKYIHTYMYITRFDLAF